MIMRRIIFHPSHRRTNQLPPIKKCFIIFFLGFTSMAELIGSPRCAPPSDKTSFYGRFEAGLIHQFFETIHLGAN
jgi:hypothetical protein